MTGHESFYEAILAEPAEVVPRLAYADWLEESGEPALVDRAEFIRAQIECSDLSPVSIRRLHLQERCHELFATHWETWLRPVCQRMGLPSPVVPTPSWLGSLVARVRTSATRRPYNLQPNSCGVSLEKAQRFGVGEGLGALHFGRGFVDTLQFHSLVTEPGQGLTEWLTAVPAEHIMLPSVTADTFAADDTPALHRVRRLRVGTFGPENLLPLVLSPHLTGVRELELLTDWEAVSADEVRVLASSAMAKRLESLTVSLGTASVTAFAASDRFPALRRLTLMPNSETFVMGEQDWFEQLASSVVADGLVELNVSQQIAWDRFIDCLWHGRWQGLRRLGVNNPLSEHDVRQLVSWDKSGHPLPHLQELSVIVDAQDLAVFSEWPRLQTLKRLALRISSEVTCRQLEPVVTALATSRLESLILSGVGAREAFETAFRPRLGERLWIV